MPRMSDERLAEIVTSDSPTTDIPIVGELRDALTAERDLNKRLVEAGNALVQTVLAAHVVNDCGGYWLEVPRKRESIDAWRAAVARTEER